jgi:hypothetical protein
MSIPAWRKVEETDDGCSNYECLSCYKRWEARTNPEWNGWQFCPYCGIGWETQISDKEDKVFERRRSKYSTLDRNSEVTLEIKHYDDLDVENGKYFVLSDWDYVAYGMHFIGMPSRYEDEKNYPDVNQMYKDYLYQLKIANKIKELAKSYSDHNSLCNNFFMFSKGYEMRFKITSRITGADRFIPLTGGIVPVIWKS